MKECENCSKEHDGSYGSGRFCEQKCSRAFSTKANRKEINKKVSKKLKGINTHCNLSKEELSIIIDKIRETRKNHLLEKDWDVLTIGQKYKRVKLEQNYACNKCKLIKWLGLDITLEIEHKNGEHLDNNRLNLEALCPNCHSQTDTWRGRNKNSLISKNKLYKSVDDYAEAYFKCGGNFRQALLSLGLAAKGANYGSMKRALNNFGIDWRKTLQSNMPQ